MTVLVIDSYLEDAPQLLQVRSIAANKGNAVALLDRTYTFQSSSAKLGALKLYKLSQAPKDMSKHGTIKAALKLVFQLEVEDNRVEVTLNTQRQRYQG
jgi:hypothetical protein